MIKKKWIKACVEVPPTNTTRYWLSEGKLHRYPRPAVEGKHHREWWSHGSWQRSDWLSTSGEPHRMDGPAVTYSDGTNLWFKNGAKHREDGPAVEKENHKEWWVDGKLHRLDGPARTWGEGCEQWYKSGKLHREDGPAILLPGRVSEWWLEGSRHRLDGPAVERVNGFRMWYQFGCLHREDGPAIEFSDGSKEWWLRGKQVDENALASFENINRAIIKRRLKGPGR